MSGPSKGVDALAVMDWAAEQVRAGAVRASYAEARNVDADIAEARAAIAELIEASRRTIRAFESLGEATSVLKVVEARKECEAAMVAQKEALARFGSQP